MVSAVSTDESHRNINKGRKASTDWLFGVILAVCHLKRPLYIPCVNFCVRVRFLSCVREHVFTCSNLVGRLCVHKSYKTVVLPCSLCSSTTGACSGNAANAASDI